MLHCILYWDFEWNHSLEKTQRTEAGNCFTLTQDEASGVRRWWALLSAYHKNLMLILSLSSFKLEFLSDLLKLDNHFLHINLSLLCYSIFYPGLHSVSLCTLTDFIVRFVGELWYIRKILQPYPFSKPQSHHILTGRFLFSSITHAWLFHLPERGLKLVCLSSLKATAGKIWKRDPVIKKRTSAKDSKQKITTSLFQQFCDEKIRSLKKKTTWIGPNIGIQTYLPRNLSSE